MRSQYFAVKWGETMRISGRVANEEAAKKDCFGLATPDMQVRSLGGDKSKIRKQIATLKWEYHREEE